jgi:hypothetical protein
LCQILRKTGKKQKTHLTIPNLQKKGILTGKKSAIEIKKNICFILNSAQDFYFRFSLTAAVQKLEICSLRILDTRTHFYAGRNFMHFRK